MECRRSTQRRLRCLHFGRAGMVHQVRHRTHISTLNVVQTKAGFSEFRFSLGGAAPGSDRSGHSSEFTGDDAKML